jgi:hypothetical protein
MTMQEEHYRKVLIFFGILFIILSSIELFGIYILMNTQINLYGKKMLFQDFIHNLDIVPIAGILLFYFLISSICFFFIIGFLSIKASSKKIEDNFIRSKKIFMLGILILIFSFIKLGYLNFLGRVQVNVSGGLRSFNHIIFTSNLGPFYIIVIWLFFTCVICFYLMVGLVYGGLGLHWNLEIQRKKPEEE